MTTEAHKELTKGTETLAIFGLDSRSNQLGKGTRSDSLMVVNVNHETKEIKVASVFRDCYVDIKGHGLDKITHAHSFGGPEVVMATLNRNFDLLLLSISSKRKCFEEQLYLEIRERILSMRGFFPREEPIFLDSHQHVHMIPLIFETVLRVVKEYKIPVKYLRIPAEPMTPFFLKPSLYFSYRPINLVKNLVLNFLWLFDRKAFRDSGISSGLFFLETWTRNG